MNFSKSERCTAPKCPIMVSPPLIARTIVAIIDVAVGNLQLAPQKNKDVAGSRKIEENHESVEVLINGFIAKNFIVKFRTDDQRKIG